MKLNNHMHACMLSCFSCVWLFVTLWTVAHPAPLSMGFSRKNTGMGFQGFLQEIFLTQESNPQFLCLLHWQAGSISLVLPRNPRTIMYLYPELWRLVTQMVRNLSAMLETWVWSLGREDPGEGNGNPLQYSCLENSMDRGAWWAPPWDHNELDMTEWLTFIQSYPVLYTKLTWNMLQIKT